MGRGSYVAGVMSLLWLFAAADTGRAQAQQRPIVAVFDIMDKEMVLKRGVCEKLTEYLGTLMTQKRFQVIPRSEIRDRLSSQKRESYRQCVEQSCQIEIGKELAAQKSLSTQIMKLGKRCIVTMTLYDLKRSASEQGATAEGGCSEDDMVDLVKKTVEDLISKEPTAASGSVPTGPSVEPAYRDTSEYTRMEAKAIEAEKRRETQERAWQAVLKFSSQNQLDTAERIAALEKFLKDFQADNPHEEEAKKRLADLNSQKRRELQERAWQTVLKFAEQNQKQPKDCIAALEKYLQDFQTDNLHAGEAKQRLADLRKQEQQAQMEQLWQQTLATARNQSLPVLERTATLSRFIASYPEEKTRGDEASKYIKEIEQKARLAEVEQQWSQVALKARDAQVGRLEKLFLLRRFLDQYAKDNPRQTEARQLLADLESQDRMNTIAQLEQSWKETQTACKDNQKPKEQRIAALKAFLARYPKDNPHHLEAKQNIEAIRYGLKDEEILVPEDNTVWLRCPVGQTWSGSSCAGAPKTGSWDEMQKACPAGYQLPSRELFVSLLLGCDSDAKSGRSNGYCRPCAQSESCSQLFGSDRGRYWCSESSYSNSKAWSVGLGPGDVIFEEKVKARGARCFRNK